jgi:hypothetical protein
MKKVLFISDEVGGALHDAGEADAYDGVGSWESSVFLHAVDSAIRVKPGVLKLGGGSENNFIGFLCVSA